MVSLCPILAKVVCTEPCLFSCARQSTATCLQMRTTSVRLGHLRRRRFDEGQRLSVVLVPSSTAAGRRHSACE